jgi:hypothetical protein
MALIIATDFYDNGQPGAHLHANVDQTSFLTVQVRGPNSVRLGRTRQELITPLPGSGSEQGIVVTSALPFQQPWFGPLWLIGSAPNTVADVQISPLPHFLRR